MAHPWNDNRPLSAWYPGGYSGVKDNKVSRTIRPEWDHEKCIMCSLCWIYCPEGCIDRSCGKMIVNLDYCRGCGVCAQECPKQAVTMKKEG